MNAVKTSATIVARGGTTTVDWNAATLVERLRLVVNKRTTGALKGVLGGNTPGFQWLAWGAFDFLEFKLTVERSVSLNSMSVSLNSMYTATRWLRDGDATHQDLEL